MYKKYIGIPQNVDCVEFIKQLPDQIVDVILTDPPYNMDYTGRGMKNFHKLTNDKLSRKDHSDWFETVLVGLKRIAKTDCHVYIFIDWRNYGRIYDLVEKYFDINNCLVWDKETIGMGDNYRYQHEFCIYARQGKPKFYFDVKNVSNIIKCKRDSCVDYEHPTQKPVDLIQKIVGYSTTEYSLVFDPFLGSGTTGIACESVGRKWLGCEIDEKYFKVAKDKIWIEQAQLKLFNQIGDKNVQEDKVDDDEVPF